jgi:Rod binding domain-containing protein
MEARVTNNISQALNQSPPLPPVPKTTPTSNDVGGQPSSISAQNMAKIDAAAKEFEAVFISEMMKPMFEGIKTDGMFGGGKGEEVFRGFMIQEYGKRISQTGKLGVANSIKSAMIRMQEEAQNGGRSFDGNYKANTSLKPKNTANTSLTPQKPNTELKTPLINTAIK